MSVVPTPTQPGKDQRYRLLSIFASYKGTTPAGALQIIRDDATVIFDLDIGATPFPIPLGSAVGGLQVPRDEAQTNPGTWTVTLGAGGSGVIGKVNVLYALEF